MFKFFPSVIVGSCLRNVSGLDQHLSRHNTKRRQRDESPVLAGCCLLFSRPILFVGAMNPVFDSAFVRFDLKIERYIVSRAPLHAFVHGPLRIATDLLPSGCFLVGRTC